MEYGSGSVIHLKVDNVLVTMPDITPNEQSLLEIQYNNVVLIFVKDRYHTSKRGLQQFNFFLTWPKKLE